MKLVRLARLVVTAELPVVLAIAPALLFPSPRRLVILAVVPITWLCARIAGGPCIPRTPMNAGLWLLLTMVGLSLYATLDVNYSLGKVSGVALGVLTFWATTRWLSTPSRLRAGTAVFVLIGVGVALLGLLGTTGPVKVLGLGAIALHLPRVIRGIPGAQEGFNPNAVAGCLVLFVPLQLTLFVTGANRSLFPLASMRWSIVVEAALLVVTVGAVLLLQSRGAWVGLLVATVAFLVWYGRRTRVLAAVALGTCLVLAIAMGPQRMFEIANSRHDELDRGRPGLADVLSYRAALWSRAVYCIQDFPLSGIGMNGFRKIVPIRYPLFQVAPGFDVVHAHNHMLQAALDLGLPGLVAYLSIWLVAAALLVIVYRRSADRVFRCMAGALGAGLIAHFVFGMTDAIALGAKLGVVFWLTLALAVALHRNAGVGPTDVTPVAAHSDVTVTEKNSTGHIPGARDNTR